MIFPQSYTSAYQSRLDLLYGMTSWLGWAFCMSIPFFVTMSQGSLLLFYAILAMDAAVLMWCYQVRRSVRADYKYLVAEIAQPMAAVGILILAGPAGLYFFFPVFFLQLVGVVALFRYQHVVIIFTITAVATAYLFFLTDSFALGGSRYMAGSVFLAALALGAAYVYIAFRQVAEVLFEVEREKIDFIQRASHELRTPLTVIKGVAGLLRDRRILVWPSRTGVVDETEVTEELIEHFESATSDLEHITERLNANSKERLKVAAGSAASQ